MRFDSMADRRKLRRCGWQTRSRSTSISDLPELVIQRIQSLLPHKQALCTSLISKSWLHAWCTFPILQFQLHHIQSSTVFFKFVDKTLKRYLSENLVAEKLNLSVDCLIDLEKDEDIFFELDYHVNQWLQTASQIIGLKDLTLSFPHEPFKGSYEKQTLRLLRIIQESPLLLSINNIPKKIVFHSLRILELSNLHFEKQFQFHQFISSSNFPIIEKLNILYCTGLERIKIEYFGCLVEFRLITYKDDVIMVDIVHCPRLCSFQYVILKYFKETNLWDFKIDSSSYTNLRFLTFDGVGIDDMLLNKIISKLPCLERLYLEWIHLSEYSTILVSSASLIELSLIHCYLKKIMFCDAPKLRLLTYKGDGSYLPNLSYHPYMKICKPLEVKLVFPWFDNYRLRKFLKVSHKIDIEIMRLDDTYEPRHALRLTTLQQYPSENVEEGLLSLTLTNFPSEELIIHVLDIFFFVSYPNYVQLCSSSNNFFKFFIKELRERKAQHLCRVNGTNLNKFTRYRLHELEIGFQKKKNDDEKQYYWEWLPWRNFLDDDGYNNLESAQMLRFRLKWTPT